VVVVVEEMVPMVAMVAEEEDEIYMQQTQIQIHVPQISNKNKKK
jgi:hypothetical protein